MFFDFFWHSTSFKNWNLNIKEAGLMPRSKTKKFSNWPHTAAYCNNEVVYLAKEPSWYYANNATVANNDNTLEKKAVYIKIDPQKLNPDLFRPDENILIEEQGIILSFHDKISKNFMTALSITQSLHLIVNKEKVAHTLERNGLCSYFGIIPPNAFVEIKEANL